MRNATRLTLAVLAIAGLASIAHAEGSPIQIALIAPVQIVGPTKSVSGLRLDLIYGKNVNVTGLDWGIVNHSTGTEFAWQSGAVNMVEKDFTGFQEGWVDMNRAQFTGLAA